MRCYIKKATIFMLITLLLLLSACGNGTKTSNNTKTDNPEPKIKIVTVTAQSQNTQKPSVANITTTEGFVTQILQRAGVNPATYETALSMKLIPPEVKRNSVLTRAQASYILWNAINKIDRLKAKNVPLNYKVEDLWESYLSGKSVVLHPGYSTRGAYVLFEQFVRLEIKYPDGSTDIKYVYNPIKTDPKYLMSDIEKARYLIQTFKKKYPNKLVVAIPERNNIIRVKNEKIIRTTLVPDPKDPQKKRLIEKKETTIRDAYYILFERNKDPNKWFLIGGNHYNYFPVVLYSTDVQPHRYTKYMRGYSDTGERFIYLRQYKIDFRFNKYIYEWLKKLPRQYNCYDYKRFERLGYVEDIKAIPQLYKEPVLRLLDLGIYIYDRSPLYYQKVRTKPGKTLTQQEAQMLIDRLFDKKKRNVFDEVTYDAALYMTQNGDVICGRSNLGNVDTLIRQMEPFSETQVIRETDSVVFETPVATLRLLPGAAETLKYQLEHSEDFKMGYWHRLALVLVHDMWQTRGLALYMTFWPTRVIEERSGMPYVGGQIPIYPIVVDIDVFGLQGPVAFDEAMRKAAYYDKPGVLKVGDPGVVFQYYDYYYHKARVGNGQDWTNFVKDVYFVKPIIPGAKYLVCKPDPKYK